MKNLRILLASLAFIFAIGAAFASSMAVSAQSRQMVTSDQGTPQGACCQLVIAILGHCDTSSPKFCDLQDGLQYWRFFADNQCAFPYKKP